MQLYEGDEGDNYLNEGKQGWMHDMVGSPVNGHSQQGSGAEPHSYMDPRRLPGNERAGDC